MCRFSRYRFSLIAAFLRPKNSPPKHVCGTLTVRQA
jgi:hypothetical protein